MECLAIFCLATYISHGGSDDCVAGVKILLTYGLRHYEKYAVRITFFLLITQGAVKARNIPILVETKLSVHFNLQIHCTCFLNMSPLFSKRGCGYDLLLTRLNEVLYTQVKEKQCAPLWSRGVFSLSGDNVQDATPSLPPPPACSEGKELISEDTRN